MAPEAYSIGQLAGLSGLPIKTIRFYSDMGLLPPAGRTEAGHRRYDATDLARLQLVRSLRDLDVPLPTIARVLEGRDSLGEILAAHIHTLETRIEAMRRQLAVLRAAARSPTESTVRRVQALARLQAVERRRLLERFWDSVLEGMPIDASLAERFRAYGTPELPDEPTPEQLDAWLELAVLASDDDFVRSTREASAWLWQHAVEPIDSQAWGQAMRALGERAAALVEAGAPPGDAAVDALIDELVEWHARVLGREDTPELRAWLSHQFETHSDPRAPRYWELVATVCGGPADSAMRRTAAGFTWLLEALKGQIARRARHDGEPTAPVG